MLLWVLTLNLSPGIEIVWIFFALIFLVFFFNILLKQLMYFMILTLKKNLVPDMEVVWI